MCSVLYGTKAPKSPSIGVEGCQRNHTIVLTTDESLALTTGVFENATIRYSEVFLTTVTVKFIISLSLMW